MKLSFRWYGKEDGVTLEKIRQIPGLTTIVSACYDTPPGALWREETVKELGRLSGEFGLAFEVVEGLPVHESIKLGEKDRERYIGIYIENLRILARHGIQVVCYNFMPVFGWLRTDLHRRLADGSATLAFDPQVLREKDPEKEELRLPGWTHSTGKEEVGRLLSAYQSLGKEGLRKNLRYFLEAVTPEAERLGLKLAIHPDDPPLPVFGLPRVVSTREDLLAIAKMTESRACGFTLCTGSLGSSPKNDVVRIARELAAMGRVHFVHARNVLLRTDGGFEESGHWSGAGSLDMAAILRALYEEGFDGYIRPDHGRMIWGESGRPGYGLFDRALGAVYLNGLWEAIEKGAI